MTPGYCASCKKELSVSSISEQDAAWCPECRDVVDISWFRIPNWVAALLVTLTANFMIL